MKMICPLILVSLGLLTGCTARLGDCTLASTKNVDFSRLEKAKVGTTRTSGEDSKVIIVIIPVGRPNLKTAMDKAIEAIPGCIALTDVAVYSKGFWIPPIVGQNSLVVEGTPLIDSSAGRVVSVPKVIRVDMRKQTAQVLDLSAEEIGQIRTQSN